MTRWPARFAALLILAAGRTASAQPAPMDAQTFHPPYISREALRAKYGDPQGRIAVIGGVEVYYKDEGQGPAVLLIHGSQSTLKTWDGVADALRGRYRIIRFDIPPTGLSGPVSDQALARLQPEDIAEQLLVRAGVSKATVVGVSSGGTLALFLAAKRPDLVARVIVSNAPADPVVTDHLVYTPAFAAQMAEYKRTGFRDEAFWNAFLDYFGGLPSHFDHALRVQWYDFNRRAPEANSMGLVARVVDNAKTVETLKRVHQPVLLIWGARDPLLPPQAAETMTRYLGAAQVSKILLPDVGHYPPIEAPSRYAQLMRAYIEAADPH